MTEEEMKTSEGTDFEIKWRKSKSKEDSRNIASKLADSFDIVPYTVNELADVISAGIRSNEIKLEKKGRGYVVNDVEKWFKERLMPNTIILTENDYKRALYRAFRLLVLANIAMTDFGSSRQRDFGQRWTDFTRGFLGEIGIEKFFSEKLGITIDLEEWEIGDVKNFLPTDITKIKDNGNWRDVKTNVSIKTSKLGSMWLDIGSQLVHSDAFVFIKIGLTVDHLTHFFKSNGFLDQIVRMGKELGEVEDYEKEFKQLCDNIDNIKPFPTYIPGFVWNSDMENGSLEIYETRTGRKTIVGGVGRFTAGMAKSVEGLGEISPPKHLASLGALRWSQKDWAELKKKV